MESSLAETWAVYFDTSKAMRKYGTKDRRPSLRLSELRMTMDALSFNYLHF